MKNCRDSVFFTAGAVIDARNGGIARCGSDRLKAVHVRCRIAVTFREAVTPRRYGALMPGGESFQ